MAVDPYPEFDEAAAAELEADAPENVTYVGAAPVETSPLPAATTAPTGEALAPLPPPPPYGPLLEILRSINVRLERIAASLERQPGVFAPQGAPSTPPATTVNPAVPTIPWNTPVNAAQFTPQSTWVCPVHGQVKVVPAGVSRRSNKPYPAFLACPVQGCDLRPPR